MLRRKPFLLLLFTFVAAICRADANALRDRIGKAIERVPELSEIRAWGEKHGVKIYLFGGASATFAAWVKENGSGDLADIYYPTQDIDLVVDARAPKVALFEEWLTSRFPYTLGTGTKSQWDVRALREKIGEKESLLENPDFLDQNNDTFSTTLIELTGENHAWDLRSPRDAEPALFRDLAAGKIGFLRSPRHSETKRFREGKNPELLSVVRYLSKAFQFGLAIPEKDWSEIKAIVDAFDVKAPRDSYVNGWLEYNAPKLVRHAKDVTVAVETLEKLGLKAGLVALSDPSREGSMGWWLSREPLWPEGHPRALKPPEGAISGETAESLGIREVAHETKSYLTYEAIRRAAGGPPNVFISRRDKDGESAYYGDGFYTAIGSRGALGNNFNLVLDVDPDAREGIDFLRVPDTTYVLWLTKDKLTLRRSTDVTSPLAATHYLFRDGRREPYSDGVREILQRKIQGIELKTASDREAVESYVTGFLESAARDPDFEYRLVAPTLAFSFYRQSSLWESWVDRLLSTPKGRAAAVSHLLSNREVGSHPRWASWVERILEEKDTDAWLASTLIPAAHARHDRNWERWTQTLVDRKVKNMARTLHDFFEKGDMPPQWERWVRELVTGAPPELDDAIGAELLPITHGLFGAELWGDIVDRTVENKQADWRLCFVVLRMPEAFGDPRWGSWVDKLIARGKAPSLFAWVLGSEWAATHPRWKSWIEAGLKEERALAHVFRNALVKPYARSMPEWPRWVDTVLASAMTEKIEKTFLDNFLGSPEVKAHPRGPVWMEATKLPPEERRAFFERHPHGSCAAELAAQG